MREPAIDRYAPPTAPVADMAAQHGASGAMKLFSAQGRIGRARYLAYVSGAFLLKVVGSALLSASMMSGTAEAWNALVAIVMVLAVLWFVVVTGIKRCHDLNLSGWWTITIILPVIAFVWAFVPGTRGGNRFGPPAPPHGLGVTLLAGAVPLLLVISVAGQMAMMLYEKHSQSASGTKTEARP